jgi:hypothetical protein
MLITAKFAGRCASCNEPFGVGDKIEWEPGLKPRHPDCYLRDERVGRPDSEFESAARSYEDCDGPDLGDAFNVLNADEREDDLWDVDNSFDFDDEF